MEGWTVVHPQGGRTTVTLSRQPRRGRKPKVKGMHERMVGAVRFPVPRGAVRMMLGGVETATLAARPVPPLFVERVERHCALLARRGFPLAAEAHFPVGQASGWYDDVVRHVPHSGQVVARQLARLCGGDSRVTVSHRSLADAVGLRNKAGHVRSYAERGVRCLVESGWLKAETTGRGQDIHTTFFLHVGELGVEYIHDDPDEWDELPH